MAAREMYNKEINASAEVVGGIIGSSLNVFKGGINSPEQALGLAAATAYMATRFVARDNNNRSLKHQFLTMGIEAVKTVCVMMLPETVHRKDLIGKALFAIGFFSLWVPAIRLWIDIYNKKKEKSYSKNAQEDDQISPIQSETIPVQEEIKRNEIRENRKARWKIKRQKRQAEEATSDEVNNFVDSGLQSQVQNAEAERAALKGKMNAEGVKYYGDNGVGKKGDEIIAETKNHYDKTRRKAGISGLSESEKGLLLWTSAIHTAANKPKSVKFEKARRRFW